METAYERGWSELLNGQLLTEAEAAGYELLITTDQGIRYQQNWTGRSIAVLVLSTNDWTRLRRYKDRILLAVNSMEAAAFAELEIPLDR